MTNMNQNVTGAQIKLLSDEVITNPIQLHIGIGATTELNLRLSGACLTLMVISDPNSNKAMAIFERVAKISPSGEVDIQLQPVGGGVTIKNLLALQSAVEKFNFDSAESLRVLDLRIFIEQSDWSVLKELLCNEFYSENPQIIETSPHREIQEELGELLGIQLDESSIKTQRIGCYLQDPSEPYSVQKTNQTARIFAVDQVQFVDSSVELKILKYCNEHSVEEQIEKMKEKNILKSSSICAVPLEEVVCAFSAVNPNQRAQRVFAGGNTFANNVYATVLHLLNDAN